MLGSRSAVDRCETKSCISDDNNITAATVGHMDMDKDYLRPIYENGDMVLEVQCGDNQGLLYSSRLCQGSKGPCILSNNTWLTPNEFQYISGRETAKDWKRSIRHNGKSLKFLLSIKILAVHPPTCDCDGCRITSLVSRTGRLSQSSKSSLVAQKIIDNFVSNNTSDYYSNGRTMDLPAAGCSDSLHELQLLIAQTQKDIEKSKSLNKSPEPTPTEKKRRLTRIIDQLISKKTKKLKEEAAKNNLNSVAADADAKVSLTRENT
uniref:SAND domain-containing protein n=1 Tax=Strigamia maritima TaxID=126957 RepID=T1IMW2_STRMM